MTISLVVFVSLQFYWLKEYYSALEQDFSNKVYTALENSSKKIEELEIQKYNEKFKNFDKTLANNAKSPTLFQIQQTQDSATKPRLFSIKPLLKNKIFRFPKKETALPK